MKFSWNLLLVYLISGLLVSGHSQTKKQSKNPHLTVGDPDSQALACPAPEPKAIKKVNLCDLAVQMMPEQEAAKQKKFWTRKEMKQITGPDHVDVRLAVPRRQEVLWYCTFSKPGNKRAKFDYTPGESRSFAIVDIKEVQTEDCDDRPLAPADNPFCTEFLNQPQTGELHSGVPRNNAVWHTYKYSFVIGSGEWTPPTPAVPATPGHPAVPAQPGKFANSISVDPHLIVTGSGTGGTDKVIRTGGGKCSPNKSDQNDNKQ